MAVVRTNFIRNMKPFNGYPTMMLSIYRYRNVPYVKPAVIPLAYRLKDARSFDHSGPIGNGGGASSVWNREPGWWSVDNAGSIPYIGKPTNLWASLRNQARSSFYNNARRLSDSSRLQAEFGQNLAEMRKTSQMVNRRTEDLNRLAGYQNGVLQSLDRPSRLRAARRLIAELRRNAKAYKNKPLTRSRERYLQRHLAADQTAKAWSSLWLEYWMGWAPIVSDVWTGVQRLGSENLPPRKVSGYTSRPMHEFMTRRHSDGRVTHRYEGEGWVTLRYQATLTSVNMNKSLIHDLGLTNPWLTVHELIPFSWLLAWGHNLRDVLRQWDDDYGLTWEPRSTFFTARSFLSASLYYHGTASAAPMQMKRKVFSMAREPLRELPPVTFQLKVPQFKASRLATVVALFFSNLSRPLARV